MIKKPFFLFVVAMISMPVLAVAVLTVTNGFKPKVLHTFGTLPYFSLTERNGDTIDSNFFKGKVWIAGFIFTRCSEQCPRISAQMQKIGRALRFKDKFRLVSISVDPKWDTKEALREYADRLNADPYKWLFLTGSSAEINRLVQNGFRLASAAGDEMLGDATHSQKLVLVDHFGKIRGYYDADEPEQTKQLLKDAKALIRQAF